MDPVIKMWMYENWLEDYKDNAELAKNHAYLLGSFWDPKAVQDLMGTSGNVVISDEKEFEQSTELVLKDREKQSSNGVVKKKRRRKIKE